MLKRELIELTAADSGHSQKTVREVLDALERVVLSAIAGCRPVMLAGLGKLHVTRRGPKQARNLHTGASVTVAARNVVQLRPSEGLTQAANTPA
jgi:nucleoid DNA-binding protein